MYLLAEISCIQVIIEITCLSKSSDCTLCHKHALAEKKDSNVTGYGYTLSKIHNATGGIFDISQK